MLTVCAWTDAHSASSNAINTAGTFIVVSVLPGILTPPAARTLQRGHDLRMMGHGLRAQNFKNRSRRSSLGDSCPRSRYFCFLFRSRRISHPFGGAALKSTGGAAPQRPGGSFEHYDSSDRNACTSETRAP